MATATTMTQELMDERLAEARTTYKLNMGYAGMSALPPGFVDAVKLANPHVVELELSSNALSALPDDLADLRALRALRAKYNLLRRLPPVIAQLPALALLELSGNQISRLDGAVVGALAALRELDLSGNALSELPAALARLPKLEVLNLANNRLEALPDDIGDLPALLRLDVSTNALRALPESMGRLRKVQRINASNNVLSKVPPSMGQLKALKELNLRYNSLDERHSAKAEEGLSRLLAFLREEAERARLEEIERLRPVGTAVGPYTEYRCKAEVARAVRADWGEFTADDRCWARSGHTLTPVGGTRFFLFGGVVARDGSVTGDLFWMTTERMEWRNQPTRGDRPCARHGHVAVYDPVAHALVVFGGRTAERRRLNDVHVLDIELWTWRRVVPEGAPPAPRDGAAADYYAGHLVLFGGHTKAGRTNDVWLLDLGARPAWSQPPTSGPAPPPRSGAAACVGGGRYLFVSGGRSHFVLDDVSALDLMTRTWLDVSLGGARPPPRTGHALSAAHGGALHLFGGADELGAPSLRMFRLPLPRAALAAAADAAVSASASGAAAASAAGGGGGASGGSSAMSSRLVSATTSGNSSFNKDGDAFQYGGVGGNGNSSSGGGGGDSSSGSGGAGAGAFCGEWEELDPELDFNGARTAAIARGCLVMYQAGSAALGRPPVEDAERGAVQWDVFRTVKLDDLRPKAPAPEDVSNGGSPGGGGGGHGGGGGGSPGGHKASSGGGSRAGSKAARVQHSTLSAAKLPAGFSSTSTPEARMAAYLEDFGRAFSALYPHRRPLYLSPPNECGVPKFVCTTLRPTLLPYPELYALEGAARFVAEYVAYEPLDDPYRPPPALASPHSTLAWQAGDAFDMAVLLASLLLGAGYDARVVVGYAPRAVALCDLSGEEPPDFAAIAAPATSSAVAPTAAGAAAAAAGSAEAPPEQQQRRQQQQQQQKAADDGGASPQPQQQPSQQQQPRQQRRKYQLRPRPVLESAVLAAKAAEEAAAAAAAAPPQDASSDAAALPAPASGRKATVSEADGGGGGGDDDGNGQESDGNGDDDGAGGGGADGDDEPPGRSRRVHAWVVVLPGARRVAEPVFVEPSTGRRYAPAASPYEGVEFVFGPTNFWVCALPEPHSDARARPANVSWDFTDAAKWEPVLDASQTRPTSDGGRGATAASSGRGGAAVIVGPPGSTAALPPRPRTGGLAAALAANAGGVGGSSIGPRSVMGAGDGSGAALRPASRALPGPNGGLSSAALPMPGGGPGGDGGSVRGPGSEYAKSEYARSEYGGGGGGGNARGGGLDGGGADEDGGAGQAGPPLLPDLPPSWVPELAVPRDAFDARCPRGARSTLYRRARVDVFARFGPCARWDGLTARLTRYADDARSAVAEVLEAFERRKDKLVERRTAPPLATTVETFAPGAAFGLRRLTTVHGQRRAAEFRACARADGLALCEEVFGARLTETFEGREDRLERRSARLAPPASASASASAAALVDAATGGGGGGKRGSGGGFAVVKVSERFARDESKSADSDAAKRVFYAAEGRAEVRYHLGQGRITAGHVTLFLRDNVVAGGSNGNSISISNTSGGGAAASAIVAQADPLAPRPRALDLQQLARDLAVAERTAVQSVRDAAREAREIARARAAPSAQAGAAALELGYYDAGRGRADGSDDEPPDDGAGAAGDYLTPFLPPGAGGGANGGGGGANGALTREQCLAVREAALRALKDRLVARAAIIQGRLDAETAAAARRAAARARDRDALTAAEEAEHERAAADSAFRIGILQRRLQQLEEAALARYHALDKRLRADPRLAALLTPF